MWGSTPDCVEARLNGSRLVPFRRSAGRIGARQTDPKDFPESLGSVSCRTPLTLLPGEAGPRPSSTVPESPAEGDEALREESHEAQGAVLRGKRVLLVEDDREMLHLLALVYGQVGAEVYIAAGGAEGMHQFLSCSPDLVVLDIMMPDIDGWEVSARIRRLSDVPILFLTALAAGGDIVRGFECGAADYVTKPFSPTLLLARSAAIVHRTAREALRHPQRPAYDDGYLAIDLDEHLVVVHGKRIRLTHTEYRLLAYLFRNAGWVLTYGQILTHLCGWDSGKSSAYVHVYISRLRKRLERDPRDPHYLLTEHGVGYRFDRQVP